MPNQNYDTEAGEPTKDQTPIVLERPATVFLSYSRQDMKEVAYLQQQLKVRGMRAWRDVTDLALGSFTEQEIIRAIEQDADAFVLYLTPQSLSSRFIWNIEIPAALNRWERNHAFGIIPILQGISLGELQQFCADHGYPPLTNFNGTFVPKHDSVEAETTIKVALKEIAKRTLKATLDLRKQRIIANRSYEPWICLRTFAYVPPTDNLDLDLDWTELFTDQSPTPEEWQDIIFPALRDVKEILSASTPSRTLHLMVQSRLSAAVAFGSVFPVSAHFTLVVESRHGSWNSTGVPYETPLLRRIEYAGNGDTRTAVMEVAISRDTAYSVAQSLPLLNLSFGHRIRFVPSDGPSNEAVKNASQAVAMSRQIGQELKRLRDREGVQHVHLFAALPAALALLLGHQLNASTTVILYFTNANGYYVPSCTLGSLHNERGLL